MKLYGHKHRCDRTISEDAGAGLVLDPAMTDTSRSIRVLIPN